MEGLLLSLEAPLRHQELSSDSWTTPTVAVGADSLGLHRRTVSPSCA